MSSNSEKLLRLAQTIKQVAENPDLKPAIPKVVEYIEMAGVEQIETEGARGGTKYGGLQKGTIKQRQKLGYPGENPILYREGNLQNFIAQGAQGTVINNGKTILIQFNKSDDPLLPRIAAISQRRKNPKYRRKIISLTIADKRNINQIIKAEVRKQIIAAIKKLK